MRKLKKCNKGGKVSNTGYKKDSPDKFNKFNIIPSNNITMDNVDFPILGIDNYGNQKFMLPGENYLFPGNYVTEIPIKQLGGITDPNSYDYDPFATTFFDENNMPNQIVPTNGGTQPPSNVRKRNNNNKLLNSINNITNNQMQNLANPYSFQNMTSYIESGVNFFDNKRKNRQQQDWLSQQGNTDSFVVNQGGDRGEYVTTGTAYGMFRPDRMGSKSPYGTTQDFYFQNGGELEIPMFASNKPIRNNNKILTDFTNKRGDIITAQDLEKWKEQGMDWGSPKALGEWYDTLPQNNIVNGNFSFGPIAQRNNPNRQMNEQEWDAVKRTFINDINNKTKMNPSELRGAGLNPDNPTDYYNTFLNENISQIDNFLKNYRSNPPKKEYGGQTGYSLDLKHRYNKIYPTDDPTKNKLSNFIKPVERSEANIEAEKGETVFGDFDNDGMFEHMEIGGNKHYNGGTPLNVPEDSFIYSDAKKLKIGGHVLESFGKSPDSKKKYTPAELAKQYKVNKFKNVIDDPDLDDPIKRRTSELMIDNYNKKLSKLALVQEAMKGFPTGIPQVAIPYLESQMGYSFMGNDETTPEASQIFKMGGQLPKALYGLPEEIITDPYAGGKTKAGRTTPTGKNNKYNRPSSYLEQWDQLIPGVSDLPNKQAQALIYDYTLKNNPQSIDDMWTTYGLTAKGMNDKNLRGLSNNGKFTQDMLTPENRNKLKDAYVDGFFGVRQLDPRFNPRTIKPSEYRRPNPEATVSFNQPIPELTPNTASYSKGIQDPTGFWTQDKINVASAINNRNNLRKYLPWQAPIVGETIDPTFYDPNRELAANAELMNTQMMYNSQFSGPQTLGARNSDAAGQAAVNVANIMGKYNNQNVGLENQFEATNTEITNRLLEAERARNNSLYDGTTISNQQFDNERSQANEVIRKNVVGALTNSQQTQWMNEWYPQYNLNPSTGRFYFDRGKIFNQSSGSGNSTPQNNYINLFNKLKMENPNTSDDVIKKQVEQILGAPARNTIDNEGRMRSTYMGELPPLMQTMAQQLGQ